MPNITVEPNEFILVQYDADEIRSITERIASGVGFAADQQITVDVEESTPLARVLIGSLTPLVIQVEGGAFEDPRRPRQLSVTGAEVALGRVLFQAHDQLFGGFADVPVGKVTLEQQVAWDVYALGRLERLGANVNKQSRLYTFRNRHGFSDANDAIFNRLWNAQALTWADIVVACDQTKANAAA